MHELTLDKIRADADREAREERADRKARFMAKVLSKHWSPGLEKEASDFFDKHNPTR